MRLFYLFLIPFLLSSSTAPTTAPAAIARAAVVMESQTGNIVFAQNENLTRSVASISKIMTAIVALENNDFTKIVTVPPEIKQAVGSMIYVQVGDTLSIEDLLYGLMLRSGNDAAITLAIATAGSLPAFVNLMNEYATKIGMLHSVFANPHGLDEFDDGNLSSAKDMARLTAYAMQHPDFRTITGTKVYRAKNGNFVWHNKHRLLNHYSAMVGGKTGYTKKAKRTLVSVARQQETEFIVVTLDCGSDFAYHKNLFEYYFNRFQTRLLIACGKQEVGGYLINVPKNYYFMADYAFWHQATFIVRFIPATEPTTAELILKSKTTEVVLGTADVLHPAAPKKPSFWERIANFFRRLW